MIERTNLKAGKDGERGASLVEYALLVALIAVVCLVAVTFLGQSGNDKLNEGGTGIAGEEEVVETTTSTTLVSTAGCESVYPDGLRHRGRLRLPVLHALRRLRVRHPELSPLGIARDEPGRHPPREGGG